LETVQWCKSQGKPVPHFTLYPRTKGFVATVKELGTSSSVKAVYDLTIAYAHEGRFMEAPEMWQTISERDMNQNWRFRVHAERFAIETLADKSEVELAQWLEDRWMAKSRKLQELQQALEEGKAWSTEGDDKVEGKKTL
jgi:hypothetical protein